MLIFDAHLDLSLNAIEYNRDLRLSLAEIRAEEVGMTDLNGRALGTVSLPEMRRGGVGLCVATLIAGCMKPGAIASGWNSPEQAWAQTQGQLAWYRAMEAGGHLRQLRTRSDFEESLGQWQSGEAAAEVPIGFVLSLEGADSILTPAHLERAVVDDGLRAMGPAHYGEGRYAFGHDREGRLKPGGEDLIREMDRLGMILDVTHLCDDTFWQVLELFDGPVWASHSNCRSIAPDVRQFSDRQLVALIERGAVIGMVFDAWMMVPGWVRGKTTAESAELRLAHIVEHIDHICQLAGNANHVGIGSDLDGGFGKNQCPVDLDSIADLQKLAGLLDDRGYSAEAIKSIFHGNFVRRIREAWPQ
jgi:membrane dipeptidase